MSTSEEKVDETNGEAASAGEAAPDPKDGAAPKPPSPAARPTPRTAARPSGGGGIGGLVPIALVVGVAGVLGYVVLQGNSGPPPAAPGAPPAVDESTKWAVGQAVEVDLTLKPTDKANLSCASPEEVAGKHCAFDAPSKPSSKGGLDDDKKILKPYAVPNSPTRVLVAGLWSTPALSGGSLPADRFTVRCKLKVEGKLNNPSIQWDPKGPWRDQKSAWFTAVPESCSIKK